MAILNPDGKNSAPLSPAAVTFTGASYPRAAAANAHNSGAFSLWDYLRILRKNKLAIASALIVGALGGFAFVLVQKPVYQATTTIEVQGVNESFMNMSSVDPMAGTGNYSSNQANINTQLRIIESASVRAPVIERLQRETTPVIPPTASFTDKLRQRIRRTPMDPLQEMKSGLTRAAASLKAKSVLGTRIIAITCDSTIPDIAANFANTIATEYIAQNTQLRSTSTQRTSQWLESQLEETKVKLEQADGRLQDFVKKSGVTFVGDQDTLANSKLRQLQSVLATIQTDRIAKQSKYEMLKSAPADSIPDVIDDQNLRDYQSKLADLQRQLAQAQATLTPAHPKVKQIEEQINIIETELRRERGNVMQRIQNEYLESQRRENLLISAYRTQAAAVTGQADKAAEYAMLKREVDIYQQTLNTMLQQVNQASVVSAVPANNIRVVDPATAPSGPYKPDAVYSVGVGSGLGLALGFGLLLLRDGASKRKASQRFGNPGSASSLLSIPELGVIPSASFAMRPIVNSKWRLLAGSSTLDTNSLALTTWDKPSLMAESFRLTFTSLALMHRNGTAPRMLVITSPGAGEGKTTVTSNIAAAMAESGRRVLTVDLDLRRPQLHTVLGVPNEKGFAELVRPNDPHDISTADELILPTEISRVFVLPSGTVAATEISELLHSPRVVQLFKHLKRNFDMVLIDTPPMLRFSESRLVASFADGAIMVLRSGVTDRDSAIIALDQLGRDGIPVLGTVLNDWNPKDADDIPYASYYDRYVKSSDKDKA